MKNAREQYIAVMIFRNRKVMRVHLGGKSQFDNINDAQLAIDRHIKENGQPMKCGSIAIEIENTGKDKPYDIVGYEIRKRMVTPFETVRLIS